MYGYFEMKFALGAAAAITGASALIYLLLRPRKRRLDPGKQRPTATYASASYEDHARVDRRGNTELPLSSNENAPLHNLNGHVSVESASSSRGSPEIRDVEDKDTIGLDAEKDFSLDSDVNIIKSQHCPLAEKDFSLDDELPAETGQSTNIHDKLSHSTSHVSDDSAIDNSSNSLDESLSTNTDEIEDKSTIPCLVKNSPVDPSLGEDHKTSATCLALQEKVDENLSELPDQPETASSGESCNSANTEDATVSVVEATEPVLCFTEKVTSLSSDVNCEKPKLDHSDSCAAVQSHGEGKALISVDTSETSSSADASCDNQNLSSRLIEGDKVDDHSQPNVAVVEVVDSVKLGDALAVNIDSSLEPVESESEEPVKSGIEEPVKSGIEEPVKSGIEELVKSGIEKPVKSGIEEPVKSGIEEPIKSGSEESVKSGSEEHVKSESEEHVKSEREEPVKSESVEAGKSESKEPVKSGSEEPVKSGSEEPVKSESEEPVKSESEEPVKSESVEAGKSESKEPVKSGSEVPVKSGSEEPVKSGSEEPVKSESEEPVKSESEEPIKSGSDIVSCEITVEEPRVGVSQGNIQNLSQSEDNGISILDVESNVTNVLSQGCEDLVKTNETKLAVFDGSSEVTSTSDACKTDALPLTPFSTSSPKSDVLVSEEQCSEVYAPVSEKSSEFADEPRRENEPEKVDTEEELLTNTPVQEKIVESKCMVVNECLGDSKITEADDKPLNVKENTGNEIDVVVEVEETSRSQSCDKECIEDGGCNASQSQTVSSNSDNKESQMQTDVPEKEGGKEFGEIESKRESISKKTKKNSPSSEIDSEGKRSYKGRIRNACGASESSADGEPRAQNENDEPVCLNLDRAEKDLCSLIEDGVARETSVWESPSRVGNSESAKDQASIHTKEEGRVVSAKESDKPSKESHTAKSSKTKKESTDSSKSKSYKERIRNAQGSDRARKSETEERTQDNNDRNSRSNESSQSSVSEVEPETLFNPSAFPVASQETYIFYEFEIPQVLVGRLIGKKGAFVNKIKAATDASIIVGPHRNRRFKMCSVEGTKSQVEAALDMIREYFPINRYPELTLAQVHGRSPGLPPVHGVINNQAMQIELAMGVVVEVRVSAVASGNEIWVQQPLHPSYSALQRLQACMNLNYADGSTTPQIPGPIPERTVCVAQIDTQWYRCQVLSATEDTVLVVLLDVGGALTIPASSLRQIRRDYVTLPFQATQCLLHGIQPNSEGGWDDTSTAVLEELVSGVILSATVVSYTPDGVPLVNLYRCDQDELVFVNERLVTLGHAQWISPMASS